MKETVRHHYHQIWIPESEGPIIIYDGLESALAIVKELKAKYPKKGGVILEEFKITEIDVSKV